MPAAVVSDLADGLYGLEFIMKNSDLPDDARIVVHCGICCRDTHDLCCWAKKALTRDDD